MYFFPCLMAGTSVGRKQTQQNGAAALELACPS